MALIGTFDRAAVNRPRIHEEVECTYDVFRTQNGDSIVQFSTLGSKTREIPGKQSQVIQLNEESAKQLMNILKDAYPRLR